MVRVLGQFWQDVRFGTRSLRQSPGFSITAVLSLALGIAATTAMFSVIHGVIIDPFPYSHPETLMSILVQEPAHNLRFSPYTPDQYLDLKERSHVFDSLIASTISDVMLTGTSNPERLRGNFVTPNSFGVLGVKPQVGRYINTADGDAQATPVVVLGYRFWQRHFGGDPAVIGRNLRLNDKVRTVVGVMPPRFMWRGADVYMPVVFQRGQAIESVRYINIMGRQKAGVTAAQAEADLHPIVQELLSRDPAYRGEKFSVQLQNFYETYPSSIQEQLWILFAAVSLLLLIACVNVSNLMLARATTRSREIAIRSSLGAGGFRIMRQLFTESLMIALASAVVGIPLAIGALHAVVATIPPDTIPDEAEISLNVPVLLFTLAIAVATALLFGIAPALQAARTNLTEALRSSGRGLAGGLRDGRLRKILVAAELSLAMVLLIGASLMIRTLVKLQSVDLGFNPESVLSLTIPLPPSHYKTGEERNLFLSNIVEQVQALPGVQQVALNTFVHPFANWGMRVEVPGSDVHQDRPAILSQINHQYPLVLQIPVMEGRALTAQDVAMKRQTAVVNQTFANLYFKGGKAVGRAFKLPELSQPPINLNDISFTVVGVMKDKRNVGLTREIRPEVYVPYTVTGYIEAAIRPMLLITSQVPPLNLVNAVKDRIRKIDPDQPVMEAKTVARLLDEWGFAGPRFSVFLFSVFGVLGLLLSAIGIYGTVNYSVSRQMQSLGVRVALGARRRNILAIVLNEMLMLLFAGVVVGAICSVIASRWLKSLIWGVSALDPMSFLAVTCLLIFAGLIACLRPAWRASTVDPMVALREE